MSSINIQNQNYINKRIEVINIQLYILKTKYSSFLKNAEQEKIFRNAFLIDYITDTLKIVLNEFKILTLLFCILEHPDFQKVYINNDNEVENFIKLLNNIYNGFTILIANDDNFFNTKRPFDFNTERFTARNNLTEFTSLEYYLFTKYADTIKLKCLDAYKLYHTIPDRDKSYTLVEAKFDSLRKSTI